MQYTVQDTGALVFCREERMVPKEKKYERVDWISWAHDTVQ